MDKFKKSGENVLNFITESLKGKNTTEYVNGKLPIMSEMRNLNPDSQPLNSILNPIKPGKTNFLSILGIILGILLLLFIIYKIIEIFPDMPKIPSLKTIWGDIETDVIKPFESNPMFDASNNLNSNQILDFLLGSKPAPSEWCFVGESKGKRYCTLTQGNECMSGNIFPTQNICVNPKLKS